MYQLVHLKLPTGEAPICNVTLEPYVLIKKDSQTTVTADDIPEEGSGEGTWQLRSRWYRSTIPRSGGAVCSLHPEKPATVQCTVCLRCKVAPHLSYHCTPECFKGSWQQHKEYHRQAHANGQENGYESHAKPSTLSAGETWLEVGRQRKYTPVQDDVGFVLKYEVALVDAMHPYIDAGRPLEAFTTRVRPAPNLPLRAMVALPPPPGTSAGGSRFTLMTYNLLADLYAKADGHSHVPAWVLSWQYRKRNLVRELLSHRADIICLQEVQSDHYEEYLRPELQAAGYVGIYKKKTGEVYTGSAYAIDGCATFYKKERFTLVKKYEVEFNKAALSLAEQVTSPQLKQKTTNRLLKDNVALIAVLESMDGAPGSSDGSAAAAGGAAAGAPGAFPGAAGAAGGPGRPTKQLICVANTHIHANPELNDVKLWQVHTLLKGLEKIANSADIPMLVTGDFNSIPGSAAHALLVKGRVEGLDAALDPLHILRDQPLAHTLPLASAYASAAALPTTSEGHRRLKQRLDGVHHEPLFTNINKDFKAALDYVLYTRNSLVPRAVLELPSEGEVSTRPNEGLPNANWPSDHISLMVEFQILPPK